MTRILRGVGQIFLQPSPISGALFLAALALNSWMFAVFALVGSLVGTLVGVALHAAPKDLDDGLYGFNAALVALAGAVFLPLDARSIAFTALGVIASTALFHFAVLRRLSVFTAPFVLTTLVLLLLPLNAAQPTEPVHHVTEVALRHFGEVIFLDGTVPGLLCLLGVFAGTRTSGLAALAASAMVLVLGLVLPVATQPFEAGLHGFNAVLAAIALHQQRPRWLETLGGALVATLLTAAAIHFGVRALTAPFVMVAWLGTRRRSP